MFPGVGVQRVRSFIALIFQFIRLSYCKCLQNPYLLCWLGCPDSQMFLQTYVSSTSFRNLKGMTQNFDWLFCEIVAFVVQIHCSMPIDGMELLRT